jgi:hypothetical protein
MKKLLLLLFPLAVACHTKTPDEKMKEGIKTYLSTTMHDFKSYEPVDYKKTDSVYTSYLTTDRASALLDSLKLYNKLWEAIIKEAREYTYTSPTTGLRLLKQGRAYQAKIDSVNKIIDSEKTTFVKRFNGYEMAHTFRGKNMNGATIITTKRFYFDTTYKVTEAVEVE